MKSIKFTVTLLSFAVVLPMLAQAQVKARPLPPPFAPPMPVAELSALVETQKMLECVASAVTT